MYYLKKFVIPGILSIGILLLLVFVRSIPVSKLWKSYTVLSVSKKTDGKLVDQVLGDNGVKDFISLENQKTEVFPVHFSLSEDSYVESKKAYFFDKSGTMKLIYIPDSCKRNAMKAVEILGKDYGVSCNLDSRSSFPWMNPVIALVTALCFLFFSKNRIVFSIPAFFVVVFSFSNPFTSDAAAACLIFFFYYIIQKIWCRKDAMTFLEKNLVLIAFTFFPVILCFSVSFISGLFFMLSVIGGFAGLFLYHSLLEFRERFYRFHPVLIRSAFAMRPMNLKSLKQMLFCSLGILVLVLFFLITGSFSSSNSKDLSIPCPEEYNGSDVDFVNMEDYFIWKWNNLTASVRSINKPYPGFPEEGEEVTMRHFKRTGEGIKETDEVLYRYDENFRKEMLSEIDSLDFPALEKLWKSEGKDFQTCYSSGKGENVGGFGLFMLIVSMLLPCAIACYYILEWRRKAYVS